MKGELTISVGKFPLVIILKKRLFVIKVDKVFKYIYFSTSYVRPVPNKVVIKKFFK